MTRDEIETWIQAYQKIEGLIWRFQRGMNPSASRPTVTLYGDKVEARVRVHDETHFSTYDSEDLADMFDQIGE